MFLLPPINLNIFRLLSRCKRLSTLYTSHQWSPTVNNEFSSPHQLLVSAAMFSVSCFFLFCWKQQQVVVQQRLQQAPLFPLSSDFLFISKLLDKRALHVIKQKPMSLKEASWLHDLIPVREREAFFPEVQDADFVLVGLFSFLGMERWCSDFGTNMCVKVI